MRTFRVLAALSTVVVMAGSPVAARTLGQTTAAKPAAQKPEPAEEKDQPVPLDKVPKVVRDTLRQYAKDEEIKSASKGDDDGTSVYEFDIEQGARKFEVSITTKGAFFGSEETIALTDVPNTPRAAIDKLALGAKVVSVEKALDKNKAVTYEAVIDKAGKKTEYAVNTAGKVVGSEKVK
jgi:hypothetical protein